MASLTDLFNPTFLMFLGILVLVVALLVVYFETKFREQNHKISSMLSLVSSLAEELNGTKMVVQHLTMRAAPISQNFQQQQQQQSNLEENFVPNNKLISVSDDEDSDSESESESGSDSSESIEILDDENEEDDKNEEEIDDNSSENSENSENSVIEIGNNNDIKVLKLNINQNNDDHESSSSSEENNLDFDDLDELDELDESDNLDKLDHLDKAEVPVMETTEDNVQPSDIKTMDLKSININLEETKHESMDYKKMSLPKLRSIVTEKGLTSDSSKLKKNELLKLLGIE
jgi:hypothetical protein